jgi:hypothetical protein
MMRADPKGAAAARRIARMVATTAKAKKTPLHVEREAGAGGAVWKGRLLATIEGAEGPRLLLHASDDGVTLVVRFEDQTYAPILLNRDGVEALRALLPAAQAAADYCKLEWRAAQYAAAKHATRTAIPTSKKGGAR